MGLIYSPTVLNQETKTATCSQEKWFNQYTTNLNMLLVHWRLELGNKCKPLFKEKWPHQYATCCNMPKRIFSKLGNTPVSKDKWLHQYTACCNMLKMYLVSEMGNKHKTSTCISQVTYQYPVAVKRQNWNQWICDHLYWKSTFIVAGTSVVSPVWHGRHKGHRHPHTFCFHSITLEGMHWFHSKSAEVYIIVKYSSSSILVIIRQILVEFLLLGPDIGFHSITFAEMHWFHWKFAEGYISVKYRSSLILVIICQILAELWPFLTKFL